MAQRINCVDTSALENFLSFHRTKQGTNTNNTNEVPQNTDHSKKEQLPQNNDDSKIDTAQLDLCTLIKNFKWDDVADLCLSYPHKAQVEEKGMTPLHLLCSIGSVPSKIMHIVLKAYPDAALMRNCSRWETPLHIQCSNSQKSSWSVNDLINICPEAASVTNIHGRTPLHIACLSNASMPALVRLVFTNRDAMLLEDIWGDTPLLLLWKSYSRTIIGQMVISRLLKENEEIGSSLDLSCSIPGHFERIWEKITFLALEATYSTNTTPTPLSKVELGRHSTEIFGIYSDITKGNKFLLHAITKLKTPIPELLFIALNRYPDSCKVTDEYGKLPLHLFSASTTLRSKTTSLKSSTLMKKFVTLYPRAVITPDHEGRIPLNLAIDSGKTWYDGVEILTYATPRVALGVRDVKTRLLPFMAAAVTARDSEVKRDMDMTLAQLDTIFLLLLKAPESVAVTF